MDSVGEVTEWCLAALCLGCRTEARGLGQAGDGVLQTRTHTHTHTHTHRVKQTRSQGHACFEAQSARC